MQVTGIGRVIFWSGGNLWIGLAVDPVPLHAHHAIQIALGFDAPVEFRRRPDDAWTAYPRGVLIRPGVPHEFKAPGRRVANILFEPESELGRALLERHAESDIVALDDDVRDLARCYDAGASDETLIEQTLTLISRLSGGTRPRRPTDSRAIRAIQWISAHLDQPLSLADIADIARLSEERMRHLFVAETGIAFRPYVLWTRLNKALELGLGGMSWTEAAHATNFSDSAHLTRTCRRMYGLAPTSVKIERTALSGQQIA
ncbi:AraC family transcriptional regulator [Mesorhizobium sp. SP-1A]|jgi:AraC-like DNA-binding protein|uniref:AraC family transcriptional regulator n=1 Tax=Mesorhizobium sp. SP-1A TaxID=3077840 RepID=UPI0028F6F314|nr:AraC family transcriptional regulator [Mesorhizobium sp. SP-1A]